MIKIHTDRMKNNLLSYFSSLIFEYFATLISSLSRISFNSNKLNILRFLLTDLDKPLKSLFSVGSVLTWERHELTI